MPRRALLLKNNDVGEKFKPGFRPVAEVPRYQPTFLDAWMDTEEALRILYGKGLSNREAEVLIWLARGKSNYEIGVVLYISPRTVSKHLEHIYSKLGVECRMGAVIRLLEIMQTSQSNSKEGLTSSR